MSSSMHGSALENELQVENEKLKVQVARLEARCRRHEHALDGMTRALTTLRRGNLALNAHNGELVGEVERVRRARRRFGLSQASREAGRDAEARRGVIPRV